MTAILHASIPADDPGLVAATLARLMGGSAMPFPPGGPTAWIAWAGDGLTEIEVVQRGHLLAPGQAEADWLPGPAGSRRSEVHLAIAVPRTSTEILATAAQLGWLARPCVRGGLFELVELWVENAFLIELFDPGQAAHFRRTVSARQWQALLEAGPPAPATPA
jgi:hypothetical protein